MTLVHDDEIEKVRCEFLVKSGAALVLGDGLIRYEIKLATVNDQSPFNLVPGIAERGKGFVLGIVHQKIPVRQIQDTRFARRIAFGVPLGRPERKSTRLNSSHLGISYAAFCLKKKKK